VASLLSAFESAADLDVRRKQPTLRDLLTIAAMRATRNGPKLVKAADHRNQTSPSTLTLRLVAGEAAENRGDSV